MSDFNYRVAGTALVPTYADEVRLIEGIAGQRAALIDIAYKHGVYVSDRHWTQAKLARLETLLPAGTEAAAYTALEGLARLLCTGLPYLQRLDPNAGEVRTQVLVSDPVEQPMGPQRFFWPWPTWIINGFWEANVANDEDDLALTTTGTIGPLSIGGSHPTEPIFTIDCNTAGANPAIEDQVSGDKLLLATSFSATDQIVINVPERLVTVNGARAKNILKINRGHWLEWPANTTPSLDWTADSGSWDVNTEWRNRWR